MIEQRKLLARRIAACVAASTLFACLPAARAACNPPAAGPGNLQPFDADGALVRQTGTQLVWQRCSVGQRYASTACAGAPAALTWTQAKDAARDAGDGWRLPSSAELQNLVAGYCSDPAIDTRYFPQSASGSYWTADVEGTGGAWFVSFAGGGGNGFMLATSAAAVRLVRAGDKDDHR